jgi:ribosome biogenesis protein Nip4
VPGAAGTARPEREARSSKPDRTSTSQRPPRAKRASGYACAPGAAGTARPEREETDDHAGREEQDYDDGRRDDDLPRESHRAPPKGAEKDRESHWIDFASKEQKDIVHEEVNMFGEGDEPWEALVVRGDNNMFFYQKGTFTSIHLLPRDAKDRFKGLMGNPGLKHFGLFLGMFHGTFNLSLEGASELAKRGGLLRNWIKLNDEGEKSFLYGQDIKKPMLQEVCPRGITHNRGICIVLNARGECIGVGKLEAKDPRLVRVDDDEVIIKNVVDRGVYLRDQGRYA